MSFFTRGFSIGCAAAFLGASASGLDASRTYGSASSVLTVPAASFMPLFSGVQWTNSSGYLWSTGSIGGAPDFQTGVQLPAGALIQSMDVEGCDENGSSYLAVQLGSCAFENCTLVAEMDTDPAGTPGCQVFSTTSKPEVVDNAHRAYILTAFLGSDSTIRFGAVRIHYRLQVSPAPATATFADVPTSYPYFRAIEAVAAAGIASGCGSGNFCPSQSVTRGELAKFLANALGLYWP